MATSLTIVNTGEEVTKTMLEQAAKKLASGEKEIVLDFCTVERISTSDIRRLEEFAHSAEDKQAKIVLNGVNAVVYKALKLVKLTHNFSFVN